jgi:hypothetical protein
MVRMPDFFHVAPPGLRMGDVIQPGNWGTLTRAFATGGPLIENHHDAINLIWEAALEAVRLTSFPRAVSRFHCVFACQTEEKARAFRDRFRFRQSDHIYRVEPVGSDTTITMGDYAAITDAAPGPYVEMAARIAADYWDAEQPRFPEALIGGAVRVIAVIG